MNFSKLDHLIDSLPACGIPSSDLAVTLHGKTVYRRSAGYADAEKTRPVSPEDLYYVFSISKITTCVCGMRLVEEGKIGLDDPVFKYLDSAKPQFGPTRLYGYSWGLCGRVHVDPVVSHALSPVGEFGWDGAAGAFALVDPTEQVAIFFGMHAHGCQYAYHMVHPKIRDLVYEAIREN